MFYAEWRQLTLYGVIAGALIYQQAEAKTQTSTVVSVKTQCGQISSSERNIDTVCNHPSGGIEIAFAFAQALAGTARVGTTSNARLQRIGGSNGSPVPALKSFAEATASFVERVTLNGRPAGTVGLVTFGYSLPGSATSHLETFVDDSGASVAASSEAFSADVRVISQHSYLQYGQNAQRQYDTFSQSAGFLDGQPIGSPFGAHQFEVPVTFGQAFDISMQLYAQSAATVFNVQPDGYAKALSIVDLSHSLYWGGVQSVMVDGEEVKDFTLLSSDGVDYSKSFAPAVTAIPEPSTYCLMLFGLAIVGASARSRNLLPFS